MNLLSFFKLATIWNMIFAPAPAPVPVVKPSVLTFDLNNLNNYQAFVAQVRDEVKDPKKTYHDLPIIREIDTKRKGYNKYFYIQVNAAAHGKDQAISVTLQLKTSDLYLVAYHDRDHLNHDRAFYFSGLMDDPKEAFPDVKNIQREVMKFTHDYPTIETAAKENIENLEFKLPNLEEAMRRAYGMPTTDKKGFKRTQALFVLYCIEMTAEAARFEYVKRKMVHQEQSDFMVAGLVRKWSKLSVQIVASKDGTFKKEVVVDLEPGKTWIVKTVNEIKDYMGILSCPKTNTLDTPIDHEL
ncbi:hypothetical protein RND81_14G002400 [Saponaria officinalis]|uniref:rRNA N-glycosylase n=1 Tax=Saponaria officinalis TaxID=3572 RepID=A0AAW1GJE4_SAPOF